MQTKSILAKTAVVISLCALCSSVFAAPTSKSLTKSEELYPICVHKGGSVLLTIIILFLHILTAARFSRVITDIGTITVPTI